ncbi:hypothetical protein [Sporomusa sphaeroides]|uniref:hypothetical protein n=1 Tax=Sporomusa sphaeroides TaxID=47679 RepID=UPI002C0313DE|nr:hypothetical protein [Sporomusa sphaeroides]HML33880.1 hypothetical protein [Sporomusa sphaeroides]
MEVAEAFNHLTELIVYMQDNNFSEEQIQSVKMSQNALIAFEMLGVISQDKNNAKSPA